MKKKLTQSKARKIFRTGDSYALTLPKGMIKKLEWNEKKKVLVEFKNNTIVIKEWKE
ncbi:MAG: AbrB/MazE/SpoVT family DNA-binding domain-containing protein [Candidatus Moraniibacteriota bacterium]